MSTFNDLEKAIAWIESQTKFSPKKDLSRMRAAYAMLDIDLSHVKKIHVAGTNGKGSTLEFILRILREKGHKIATFRSPYVFQFNERIGYDLKYIRNAELLDLINEFYDFNETFTKAYGEHLSFFELLTLMAFKYTFDKKADFMIIEVGIGGLLDATNILDYDLSLITNIGYDHMHILGDTLESIAINKLGILKKGNHLISTVDQALHQQFKQYADQIGATLNLIEKPLEIIESDPLFLNYEGYRLYIAARGTFQAKNVTLAIAAAKYFYPDLDILTINRAFKHAKVIGRFYMLAPQVYADGAHNISAMRALVDHLKEILKKRSKIKVIFSALNDKDINGMLDLLEEISDDICITSFPDPRFKSLQPFVRPGMYYNEDALSAFQNFYINKTYDEAIVITGSFHFVSHMIHTVKAYQHKVMDAEDFAIAYKEKYMHLMDKDLFDDEE